MKLVHGLINSAAAVQTADMDAGCSGENGRIFDGSKYVLADTYTFS